MREKGGAGARPEWLDDKVLKGGLLVFAALCLATELALRLAAPAVWRDPANTEAVSGSLLEDRLDALAEDVRPAVLFLGDSVSYGSALREHGVSGWREQTPPAFLRRRLGPARPVHSLAFDGACVRDLEALFRAAEAALPSARTVVLQLNYRMLAAEAGGMARPYLAPWAPEPPGGEGPAWEARAGAALRRHWAAYRYAELLSYNLFQPSLGVLLDRGAQRLFPPQEDDEDLQEALLDMKIRPDYAAPGPSPGHGAWRALDRLAAALGRDGRRALVFLTPQNMERVEGLLAQADWRANRAALKRAFAARPGLRYLDWAERVPAGSFLDHCHLDPEGNRALADWIAGELDHEP